MEALLSITAGVSTTAVAPKPGYSRSAPKQILDGSPMTEEEVADFRAKTERFWRTTA